MRLGRFRFTIKTVIFVYGLTELSVCEIFEIPGEGIIILRLKSRRASEIQVRPRFFIFLLLEDIFNIRNFLMVDISDGENSLADSYLEFVIKPLLK